MAEAVTSNVYVPPGTKLVPLVAPLPLSNSTKVASFSDDDTTRERFVAAGCAPFTYPTKDGERMVMSYYRPPEEALESPPLMLPWARLAFEAALRAANAKAAKKPPAAKKKSTAKKPAAKKAAAGRG